MQRKIIQHGPSSLVITLPSNWVKKNQIKKGDLIEIIENNNQLFVSTKLIQNKNKKITIPIDNLDRSSLLKKLIVIYTKGYNEILIKFKQNKIKDLKINKMVSIGEIIRRYCNRFIGFEIVKQDKENYVLKEVSKSDDKDFEVILKRTLYLMQGFGKEIIDSLRTKTFLSESEAYERHDNIAKFIFYSLRLLNMKAIENEESRKELYRMIYALDMILDYFRYLSEDLNKVNNLSNEVKKIIQEIIELFKQVNKLYFSFNLNKAQDFTKKRFQIKRRIKKLKNKDEVILITRFSSVLEETQTLLKIVFFFQIQPKLPMEDKLI